MAWRCSDVPTLTLICATKNRPDHVIRRISAWCASGVDAVVIVDATSDASKASEIEAACERHGATYVRFPASVRDTRSKQRNLGVRVATTEWVLVQDDDDNILAELDHAVFDRAAEGMDYVWDGKGNHLLFHRRANFLRLGGYPEDMVNAEDMVFSRLVRATSRGGLEGPIYISVEPAKERGEMKKANLSRISNLFWYAFTFLRFLVRSPREESTNIIIAGALMPARFLKHKLPMSAFIIVLTICLFGFTTGFAWHYLKLGLDNEFRRSLALYRQKRSESVDV